MSLCDNCINYPCTDGMSVMLKSCPAFSQIPKPPTNADRIRSMTDEELAEWIAKISDCGECEVCSHVKCMASEESCACAWRDWLKQEVSDA